MNIEDLEKKIVEENAMFLKLEKEGTNPQYMVLFRDSQKHLCYICLHNYSWNRLNTKAFHMYDTITLYDTPTCGTLFSREDIIEEIGWNPVELTIEEIAKKFNLKPSQIRIKE